MTASCETDPGCGCSGVSQLQPANLSHSIMLLLAYLRWWLFPTVGSSWDRQVMATTLQSEVTTVPVIRS